MITLCGLHLVVTVSSEKYKILSSLGKLVVSSLEWLNVRFDNKWSWWKKLTAFNKISVLVTDTLCRICYLRHCNQQRHNRVSERMITDSLTPF